MNNMVKIWLLLVCQLLGIFWARAQEFEAILETPEVVAGTTFEISFALRNAEVKRFRPPNWGGLSVAFGPSQTHSMSIIKGLSTTAIGWDYQLKANKAGQYTIGEASVETKEGKTLRTKPVKINVMAPRTSATQVVPPKGPGGELFAVAELDQKEAFIGQQLTCRIKIYTLLPISNISINELPAFEGFYAKEKRRFDAKGYYQVLNGKKYAYKIVDEIALFPQKEGWLNIGQAIVSLLAERDQSGFGVFPTPVSLKTEPVSIEVKALPTPVPANFSNNVGRLTWEVTHDLDSMDTDNALTIHASVHGNGDSRRFVAPKLAVPDGLEVFDPKLLSEEDYENGVEMVFDKKLEYVVLPKTPGRYAFMPEFVFFDPDSNAYRTLKGADSIRIKVSAGPNYQAPTADADTTYAQPLVNTEQPGAMQTFWTKFVQPILPLLLLACIFTAFWVLIYALKKQKKLSLQTSHQGSKVSLGRADGANQPLSREKTSATPPRPAAPPPQAKTSTKESPANLVRDIQKRLEKIWAFQRAGDARAFYDEVYHLLVFWASAHLQLGQSEVNPAAIHLKIKDRRANSFQMIWDNCEAALFAHQDRSAKMMEVMQQLEFMLRA